MSGTWELFALSEHPKKQRCIQSQMSTVQVESEHWTVHSPHQTQLLNPCPPPTRKKGDAPPLHDATSHWLHGCSIPSIGCHYFWPELIALPFNTAPMHGVVYFVYT
jgi:hypothetical protein